MIALEGKRNWDIDNWGEANEKVRDVPKDVLFYLL